MHSVSRRLSFRALVRALHSRSLSRWTCRVTALLVMLVVALTGGLALAQTPPPKTSLKVGDMAPDFELSSTTPGKKIKLSDFRGKKIVVVAFFPAAFTGG